MLNCRYLAMFSLLKNYLAIHSVKCCIYFINWITVYSLLKIYFYLCIFTGFPHSSVGKSSACNAGDPGWIPGSGRSSGKGNGNPLQYSCLENPHEQYEKEKRYDTRRWTPQSESAQ